MFLFFEWRKATQAAHVGIEPEPFLQWVQTTDLHEEVVIEGATFIQPHTSDSESSHLYCHVYYRMLTKLLNSGYFAKYPRWVPTKFH